jgi:2'-5' RNA ligase
VIHPHSSAVIIPVPAAEALVGDLRRELDPSARRGIPAHITLIVPFVAAPVPSGVVRELTAMFGAVAPFELQFRSIGRFARTLFLTPSPADEIVSLIEALVRRWPEHPPYGGIHDTLVPHLTVADDQDAALFDALVAKLTPGLPLITTITEAWLIESDEHGFWHRRVTLGLEAITLLGERHRG